MLWWLPFLIACTPSEKGPDAKPPCARGGSTELLVLSEIRFPREEDGVSTGFDLDGDASVDGGLGGCGVGDYTAPDGTPGIDNALARLRPALDLTEGAALDAIVLEAINSGGLLAMVQLDGVNDPENDACVDLSITSGIGLPMVGNDGLLLPSQTFDRDLSEPASVLDGARIVDGTLIDGTVDLSLPFAFLDADLVFHVSDGMIELNRSLEGRYSGVMGGAVPIQELKDLAHNTGIAEEVEQLLDGLLGLVADLNPDDAGQCQDISVTLEFEAVQAFWYE